MKRFIKVDMGDRDIDELIRMPYRERDAILAPIYRDAVTQELLKRVVGINFVDYPRDNGSIHKKFVSEHTGQPIFTITFDVDNDYKLRLKIDKVTVAQIFPYTDGRISLMVLDKFIRVLKENHCYQLHAALTEVTSKYETGMKELARRRGLDVSPDIMLMLVLHEDEK